MDIDKIKENIRKTLITVDEIAALDEKIEIWEKIVIGQEINEGEKSCPLRQRLNRIEARIGRPATCVDDCLIGKLTERPLCKGLGYYDLRSSVPYTAERFLNNLKTLRNLIFQYAMNIRHNLKTIRELIIQEGEER